MSGFGRAQCVALRGLAGIGVQIEVHASAGLPAVIIVGLPGPAVQQARHRTWSAIARMGLSAPRGKVVINLTPASLPKTGTHFDLAMAVAVLRASGVVPQDDGETALLGELGLDGRLRPVAGLLPLARAAAEAGMTRLVVPSASVDEAALVAGLRVLGAPSLAHAAALLGAEVDPEPVEAVPTEPVPERAHAALDLAEVIGNRDAVDALEVAAAGAHHLMMVGPPGAGKTMLAMRLPGILPPLSHEQALEVASLRSLAGEAVPATLDLLPPFEHPHHTATGVALVGGGSGTIRPGAAARASHGVLFLDEAPEFPRAVLDMLRQPLESGTITIDRASGSATFPARFQLLLAANPCPCGLFGSGDCTCAPQQRRRYFGRLSGPLLDRVDLQVRVDRVAPAIDRGSGAGSRDAEGRSTADAAARVAEARARAARRLAGTAWTAMGHVPGPWLRRSLPLDPRLLAPLERALESGALTMRGLDRTVRVAWTMADLDGAATPTTTHIGRALALRKGIPA
ncbi:YifB family Mg chelatase-like AAA ATPase [Agrococcus sp. Marseille-P2731]|uniref:YifB family Mg chelatase-like AAA ATPase n=1 Tax=Agrococcus sp. Marseille-P2731 TaxID=1841862 RepID=UPI000930469D|nr:YifB family Mg chelatase-like AAA ATPase [Agrococcus sp. Marseille-P2731]